MKKIVKKKKRSSKKLQRGTVGNFFVFGVLALLVILGITAVGGLPSVVSPSSGTSVQIVTPTPDTSHNTLQLETFGFTTIVPTSIPTVASQQQISILPTQGQQIIPTSAIQQSSPTSSAPNSSICPDDDDGVIVPSTCQCPDDTLECISDTQYKILGPDGSSIIDCTGSNTSNCGAQLCGVAPYASSGKYCVAKPVIYLYPTVPTYVSVQVITSGHITVSNPTYPLGGWKNILAYPNGSLNYQNQLYSELFYESSVTNFQKPNQGIVIPTNELSENLNSILSQLGLIGSEKKEFIAFWLPRLQALNSSYIFFSVLSPSAKGAIDHVVISPKPSTQIAFIAYFKPISTPNYGSPLTLPPTPQRIGFTSVEWGGVIDK